MDKTILQQVTSAEEYILLKELFLEYAQSLDFDLCFQDFE